jgi:hypothetical protein
MEKDAKAKSKHNPAMDQHVETEIAHRVKGDRKLWKKVHKGESLAKHFGL